MVRAFAFRDAASLEVPFFLNHLERHEIVTSLVTVHYPENSITKRLIRTFRRFSDHVSNGLERYLLHL